MVDSCGLGRWFAPRWLQSFATPRWFLVVYGLLGTIQAMAFIYFVATLTTLEKRFKIPSKTTGILMSGNEVSQILLSLSLSYYGGQGNRPRWIATGVACAALSCFILALPHTAYGAGKEALSLTKEYQYAFNSSNSKKGDGVALCSAHVSKLDCDDDIGGEFSMTPLLLIFLSQFVLGVGTTLYYALGQTYLDDNTKKTNTPFLLGCVMALRTVGPALGFVLGSACLSLYIDPRLTPLIIRKDPRWLGAWWLGWVILGFTMLLLSVLIAMFPKQLPRKRSESLHPPPPSNEHQKLPPEEQPLKSISFEKKTSENSLPSTQNNKGLMETPPVVTLATAELGFLPSLKSLVSNKLLMCNNLAGVFYILGASGYITFSTKYMETQFHQSAAGSSMFAGSVGLTAMVVGFLVSGFVISKYKPRPLYLLGWNVVVGIGYVVCELIFTFLGCPEGGLHGQMENGGFHPINLCNANCSCTNLKYSPVCHEVTSTTFYSACHAGCTTLSSTNSTKGYSDCSCIGYSSNVTDMSGAIGGLEVSSGPCFKDCTSTFIVFISLLFVMHLLGSTGKIGNVLVNYRSVKTKDKSFAQGLTLLMVSLFAFIPGPILYGAIIDSTCLVWDESCKQKGNCWLYHKDNFRFYLNSTAAVLTLIGVTLDCLVCYLGRNLVLYEENEEPDTRTAPQRENQPTAS